MAHCQNLVNFFPTKLNSVLTEKCELRNMVKCHIQDRYIIALATTKIKKKIMKKRIVIILTILLLCCIPIIAQDTSKLDQNLIAILDTIYNTDQNQLGKIHRFQEEFGFESDKTIAENEIFKKNHLIHLKKIETILKERGWLGADVVGDQGNSTIYLIIQHSELEIQLKYLPMMREAAKKGNVVPRNLAHLEDRIASKTEKPQIYGSTIKRYHESGIFDVWPIEDPKNVDKRRLSVGLGPIAPHLKNVFGLDWNLEKQIERTKKFKRAIAKKQ